MKPNIKAIVKTHLEKLRPEIEKFPWENKAYYGNFLEQTYGFVKHSTNLLALSSALSKPGSKYHRFFLSHLEEEHGHDKLLVNDMKQLGHTYDPTYEPSASTALYQAQYYYIQHLEPLALFGYMLMLEAAAVEFGPMISDRAAKAHGKAVTSFLRVHSTEDIDHVESDFKELETLPEPVLNCILKNMNQTFDMYRFLLWDCQTERKANPKAA